MVLLNTIGRKVRPEPFCLGECSRNSAGVAGFASRYTTNWDVPPAQVVEGSISQSQPHREQLHKDRHLAFPTFATSAGRRLRAIALDPLSRPAPCSIKCDRAQKKSDPNAATARLLPIA